MKTKSGNETIEKTIQLYKNTLINDTSLVLNISDDKYRYVTKLIEFKNNEIIFEAPIHKLDWVIFANDDNLDISFISKLCLFNSQIRIIKKYKQGNNLIYAATITSPIIKKQQRQSFRLDTIFNITYCVLDSYDDNATPTNPDENLPLQKAVCVNISAGGICFNSPQKEDASNIILLNFNFMDTDFKLYGEILDVGEKNNVGYYQHRIRFLDMDKLDTNSLTKAIYKKQQNMLKTTK